MRVEQGLKFKGLIAGVVAATIACGLYWGRVFEAVEYQIYDQNFRMAWQEETPSEIVIVAIDTPSLSRIGRWPWPREFHAEVLNRVSDGGAKVIGVDIGFFEPDRTNPHNDEALIAAARNAGNVVFPVVVEQIFDEGEYRLTRFEPLPGLVEHAAGLGHAHIEPGADGIVRKVHLAYHTYEKSYWGLNVAILREYLDVPEESIRPMGGNHLAVGNYQVPVFQTPADIQPGPNTLVMDHELLIGFVGDKETFTYVSAHELLSGTVDPSIFQGKIVLYGGNASGLFDDHMTPFSAELSPTPGVEIQANVINAILKNRHIVRADWPLIIGLCLFFGVLIAVVYDYFDTRLATALMLFSVGSVLGAHYYLFNKQGFWVEVSPVLAALILSFVFGLMLKMRGVNVALDQEVLNLSQAASLSDKAGIKTVLDTFRGAEPTLRDVMGVQAVALLRVSQDKSHLTSTAQYGLSRNSQPAKIKLSGELSRLLVSLEPISIDDVAGSPLGPLMGNKSRGHHALVAPLVGGQGETVGAMCLFRSRQEEFSSEDEQLIHAFSRELGSLWYNAELYERLTKRSSNPFAPFTYKSQERRIQTLNVLSDAVLSEKSLMSSVMDSIADGVIVTDVLGTIKILNPKAREIFGLYAEDAIGQSAVDFIRRFEDVPFEDMREQLKAIVERGETFSAEIKLSLPTARYYTLSLGPVRTSRGSVEGVVGVLSDITQLKEMDQMKTDLMSMVTHEIRTPLATVRGFAQILLKGGVDGEKAKEFLAIINRQSNRLVNLVNDFLDISRIESGRQVITRAPMSMERLIQNALADLEPLADEKNIRLSYEPPSTEVPEVEADRNLMEQVLINLLSNAIKYSPKGAQASVALRTIPGKLIVDVKDTGLGIPADAVPRLFEKFYRVRSDDRKDIIGTGLGLSLVKQIIDCHEGTIHVDSVHGKGSTFTFMLPLGSESRSNEPEEVTADTLMALQD